MEFTDLILLVGTNPLPNAVVASYFIKNNAKLKKIWLVHSGENGTGKYAKTLKEFIKNESEKVKIDDSIIIKNTAQKKSIESAFDSLFSKISQGQTVHLNYTGGTKSMVVHAYRFVERRDNFKPTFSYLDSNKFRLFFDNCEITQTDDLRNEINISFEEMYKLHEFEGKANELIFENANNIFENLIEEDKLDDFYFREGNGGYTRKLFENEEGKLAEKPTQIKKKDENAPLNLNNFKINSTFSKINEAMVINEKQDYRLFRNRKFNNEITNKKFEKAVKYLDGKWLEQVIYNRLRELPVLNKYKIEISSNIRHKDWPKSMDFEIDLVAIRGYQLIGISCTTSHDNSLCKSKGFEVIHRAKQIGGDEAKMVLITMLDNEKVDRLEKTLQYDTGNENKVIVLGKCDLKKEKFNKKIKSVLED